MVAPTIALAVPWCPWLPERAASMARLRYALGIATDYDKDKPHEFVSSTSDPRAGYREFGDKLPNDVWSEQVFSWLASMDADWCMQIQEDAVVPPNLWKIVHAIIEAAPEGQDVIGLHVCSPIAEGLVGEGVRLFTTADALVGVCWLIRRTALVEFLAWRKDKLVDGWRTPTPPKGLPSLTEDTMLALWAMTTGRKILHTIPAIVDHDISMASVWGNDDHQNRRPKVPWTDPRVTGADLEDPAWWRGGTSVPHIGRFYEATPRLAKRWVKDFTTSDYGRAVHDDGSDYLAGMKHRMLAKAYTKPKYRLFVGTPYRTGVHPEYVASIFKLQRMLGLDVQHEMSLDVRHELVDLVRVRSRMVRLAVESEATHLMFADGDNAWSPETVISMLRTGLDYVQAPYLSRDGAGYHIRPIEDVRRLGAYQPEHIQPDQTVEIEGTGFGLTMLSRSMMEQMLTAYGGGDLDFLDLMGGQPAITTALFMPMILERGFMGEDLAFAHRWRQLGGKVWMYIGKGTPIAHFGEGKYQGKIEDLGFSHTEAAE